MSQSDTLYALFSQLGTYIRAAIACVYISSTNLHLKNAIPLPEAMECDTYEE